jgi:protein-tyrosine phosphatase
VGDDGAMSDYRITVVCTGNICRSPIAEWVLRERFEAAGLGDRVAIDSAGTTAWEEGNPADPRSLAAMQRHGHTGDYTTHRARVFDKRWFAERDLVLAADHGHYTVLRRLAGVPEAKDRIRMIRSFDPSGPKGDDLAIPDPWYGDDSDFDATYAAVEAAADGIVEHVRSRLEGPPDA